LTHLQSKFSLNTFHRGSALAPALSAQEKNRMKWFLLTLIVSAMPAFASETKVNVEDGVNLITVKVEAEISGCETPGSDAVKILRIQNGKAPQSYLVGEDITVAPGQEETMMNDFTEMKTCPSISKVEAVKQFVHAGRDGEVVTIYSYYPWKVVYANARKLFAH
jgi:hypothetical protein